VEVGKAAGGSVDAGPAVAVCVGTAGVAFSVAELPAPPPAVKAGVEERESVEIGGFGRWSSASWGGAG
jgi:hypothetical protein